MIRILPLAVVLLVGTQLTGFESAWAGPAGPPPPPATPGCQGPCGGPPPPPTRVPTAPATVLPVPTSVIGAQLSPTHVHRGHVMKLVVSAATGEAVTASVRYGRQKPAVYKGKIGGSGTYQKSWKVPASAAIGAASLKLTIADNGPPYSQTLHFVVVK